MRIVNVAELKSRLSHHLRMVRRGRPILVRDRDRVIARIDAAEDPAGTRDDDARWAAALEMRGILRRGEGPLSADPLSGRPRIDADVVAALIDERREGP